MKKKLNDVKHGKRNFGIFLLFLQCLGIYGATLEGNHFPINIAEWFGFLSCGIIGLSLIISDIRKNKTSLHINFSTILTIILLFSISLNIFQFLNSKKVLKYTVNNDGTVDIEDDSSIVGYITVNESQILELQQKLEFYDNHVVIVPTNTNYYMTYDQYKNSAYDGIGGMIFNTENAIAQGYQKYTIYNAIIDGTYKN